MQRLGKARRNARNDRVFKKAYLWVTLVVCLSGFVRVFENINFQSYNVPYSPSIRKHLLTFKTSEPIGEAKFIDFIK